MEDGRVLLSDLVAASDTVRSTAARRAKTVALAGALRALTPDEVTAGAAFLSGEARQRPLGVGWAALKELPPPAGAPGLTVGEVDPPSIRSPS